MGANESAQKEELEQKMVEQYEHICRYELMRQDLIELADTFLRPCGKVTPQGTIISEFLPKEIQSQFASSAQPFEDKDNRSGHSGAECQSTSSCAHCKARHHTLLHRDESRLDNKGIDEKPEEVSVKMVSTEGKAEGKQTVLLSTASVWANSANAGRILMRILIDTGSQCNFITKECCQRLKLPIKPVTTSVSGIGSDAKRVRGLVNLTFRSRFRDEEYDLKACVIDKITDNLPSGEVDQKIYEALEGLEDLADESLTKPGPIDGLVGAVKSVK